MRPQLLTVTIVLAGCDSFLTPVPEIEAPNDSTVCGGLVVPEAVSVELAGTVGLDDTIEVTLSWNLDANLGIGVERRIDGAVERRAVVRVSVKG